jgi:hypothetical protein
MMAAYSVMGGYSSLKIKKPGFPDFSTLSLTGHPPPITWIAYMLYNSSDFVKLLPFILLPFRYRPIIHTAALI